MATIMRGKDVSLFVYAELKIKMADLLKKGLQPSLATVRVGDDKASEKYVAMKHKACKKHGLKSIKVELPDSISEKDLCDKIDELNTDKAVHGILVQLPLPKHIYGPLITERVSPEKDVDCFHSHNLVNLWRGNGVIQPCTPKGIMSILDYYGIDIEGKNAVVVGRSMIVGKPMASLLSNRNATVTIAHSRTKDLDAITRSADILVASVGKAHLITAHMVKYGAVVVDVGNTYVADSSKKSGFRVLGDVAFANVKNRASYITPVPGGVGPMTIASLLENTVMLAEKYG